MKTKSKPHRAPAKAAGIRKPHPLPVSQSPRLPIASLSAFDPSLPQDGALIVAAVLRDQLNALNDDIQTRATQAAVAAEVVTLEADIEQRATTTQLDTAVNSLQADIATRATQAALDTAVAALNANIDTRATVDLLNATVASAVSGSSNNSNGVGTLSMSANSYYDQWQMQQVIDKLDELINALRR